MLDASVQRNSQEVAEFVTEELGYPPEEGISLLVGAIAALAQDTADPQLALDEAVDLLTDIDPEEEELALGWDD